MNLGKLFLAKRWKPVVLLVLAASCFVTGTVFAGDSSQGLGQIAQTVTGSFAQFGQLMIAVSYLAGIGFSIAAIFKFKQHKDNPTQIPLGTPLALLTLGIVLIFLPSFIEPAGKTLFGSGTTIPGGFTGKDASTKIPGGTE